MTQLRHWLCTAAMVLSWFRPLSMCPIKPLRYRLLSLGAGMQRREFITLVGGAAAWPVVARAQQLAKPVVGFLSIGSREADISRMNAVRRGLAEIGYVEGQNVAIEYRGAQYQHDRLPALAVALVSRQAAVIIVVSTSATLAAKAATDAIPIVFTIGADPVQLGSLQTSIDQAATSQAYT